MKSLQAILFAIFCFIQPFAVHASSSTLLAQAQAANPPRYQFAVSKAAEIRDTSDNKAFTIWWQPTGAAPTGVIVTLHGHGSYATDDFYLWQPYRHFRRQAVYRHSVGHVLRRKRPGPGQEWLPRHERRQGLGEQVRRDDQAFH